MQRPIRGRQQGEVKVIVFGNEKGGSGKSTSAMHVAIALVRDGHRVCTIDLDARQGTLTRYMANRFRFVTKTGHPLKSPDHLPIEKSNAETVTEQKAQDGAFLMMALSEMKPVKDYIIIDTPGADTFLSREAHAIADVIVTPMNDSFIDLDLLGDIDLDTYQIKKKSIYTKQVDEARARKALSLSTNKEIDWVVMRNRLSHLEARNKTNIEKALNTLAPECGFRMASGFGERVIFRELFLKGTTLLDLEEDPNNKLTMSQVAARQEVRSLLCTILPELLTTKKVA